ncbi:MAG: hypothetical protein K6E30_08105 [Lachnospiraceae bacterium]|nr:hypothetical protein [Lachnospiraceae bacterium]
MTAECALVLPVFLFAVLTLISFMDAVRMETLSGLALSNRARKMAAAASSESSGDFYVDLYERPVYRYPFKAFPMPDIPLLVRARVRSFSGYALGSDPAPEEGKEIFYLSDNAEVYHTHADCTHLDLAVYKTSMGTVKSLRNAYGRRYRPCKDFPEGWNGPVYVSKKGDYYYPSLHYNSLTRHVHIASAGECEGLPLCSRCAARDAREKTAAPAA